MGSTRARVGQDGSTRYVALYRDLRGRQRSAGTFTTEKQADKAWQRAEALVESGRLGDLRRGRQTFRHYVETVWLPAHQIEASTRERYTYMIGKHLMPQFGAMRMIDILPEHIRDWIASQKASACPPPRSPGTRPSCPRSSPPRSTTRSCSCTPAPASKPPPSPASHE
jgi:Phage integrase, N-terminal SAM-like domain